MGKVHTVRKRCVPALHRMHVESRVFYPTISQRSCHVQHTTCSHNAAGHSMFNIQEFQAAFTPWYYTVSGVFYMGKVQTVCIRCVLALHKMRLFYPTISLRSCHEQHTTCSRTLYFQYIRVSSCLFTIILYCKQVVFIWEKCIQCAYGVCSCIAQNVHWITVVLTNNIAAILPCTALYVKPKCSHTLYVQYTRVSSWFFTMILYCQQKYFTLKRGYSVHTVCFYIS